ncbi:hypothetical protein AAE02nite_24040 [Adhaeribacter aerolatus]|uniref:DUF4920 domain-containing protein n=2 Tax=Adhaeribacter aerolatus TaxID=670289 RepID=A0A512AYG2_9BACT|nr:hypothetical protein AAE02nite_24040 [Adhaeribacter aerolatus]
MNNLKLTLLVLIGLLLSNCQGQTDEATNSNIFGKALNSQNSVAAAALPELLGPKDSVAVKVAGEVLDVCQAKGCWMDVKLKDNNVMKVRFKDYGFFVPKDIAGKTVVMHGMAYKEMISVADQRHYAQDAGKSEAEIKAITQPQNSITFVADGVLVQ